MLEEKLELLQQSLLALSWNIYAIASLNVLLIFFARPILSRLSSGGISAETISFRVNLLRGLNIVILMVLGFQYLIWPAAETGKNFTILSILAILYIAFFINSLLQFFVHRQYGKTRQIAGKTYFVETYQARLLSILAAILITIVSGISIVHQLGFDNLLEATGVLGILGVILGLTQGSWAPDIISGLIILNSDMFEEGDIVDISDGIVGRVFKTKLFHTEILNLSNNHRIMIRNAQLRDKVIHNLSKFASSKGLRECLVFKIGYDVSAANVKKMFAAAYETAVNEQLLADNSIGPEIKILDTGDHAIEWGFIYHIKNVEQIINIRRSIREIIFNVSLEHNLSLATPITLHQV